MPVTRLSNKERDLLAALDDHEWRTVGYRLGNFFPWDADELVVKGLAERRERERKKGAHEYRLTAAGRKALSA